MSILKFNVTLTKPWLMKITLNNFTTPRSLELSDISSPKEFQVNEVHLSLLSNGFGFNLQCQLA